MQNKIKKFFKLLHKRKKQSFNKEDDQYLVIGTEDGYFDHVDIYKYIAARERLKEDNYAE